MTLRVELDRLHGLGATLHGLAEEAGGLKTSYTYYGTPPTLDSSGLGGMEPAVQEAISINVDVVNSLLVASIKERLSETGDVMQNVANEYREADEATVSLDTVMTIYGNATGDWDVPEVPR